MRGRARAAAAAAVLLLLAGCSSGEEEVPPVEVALAPCPDATAEPVPGGLPDVALPCLTDEGARSVSLARLPHGTPRVVNLYASWCGPCKDELPAFGAVSQAYGGRVAFTGVLTKDASRSAWRPLLADAGVSYPSVRDDDGTVLAQSGIAGLPATLLIDADGTVVTRYYGPLDAQKLTALVTEKLGVPRP